MASRPWSRREVAVLERLADNRNWIEKAVEKLPDRTEKALRSRMQLVRLSSATDSTRMREGCWMRDAAAASQQLAEATLRVGKWA